MDNKELLPTKESDRTMSLLDYTLLWAGMTINIVAFSLGAQYYDNGNGLSPWMMILVMMVGYGIVTLFTAMIGDIGTKYGIPFVVYSRAPFGYKGAYIAGIIRAIPGMYWFGFLTWIGANSLNHIIEIISPNYSNLTVILVVFAVLQIINTMYGLKAMAKFDWIAIPCLAIMFGAILVATLNKYHVTIPEIMAIHTKEGFPFAYAVAGIAGGWITMALNGSDLSRQIKHVKGYEQQGFWKMNRYALIGQIVGLMFVGVITMMIGAVAGITTGFWDLNDVILALFKDPLALLACFIVVVFAQWSTNTAANLLPPALVLLNIFPRMKFWMSTVICGTVSMLMMPWKMQMAGGFLVQVQNWISQMLGPIIGILIVDYFIVRKMKLNVVDLYNPHGQYLYHAGYNISALLALVLAFILGLFCGNYAFFAGLFSSMILYAFLMKIFTLKKFEQHIGIEVHYTENMKLNEE